MGKLEKIYQHILLKISDSNVSFETLRTLLISLGFQERIKGDHFIFTKNGIEEILNLQPKNGKGKPYQIKQVREIILKYNIRIGEER